MEQTNSKIFKTPSQSAVEMTELVLPNDTNLLGNLLGGRMMHWMDIAGAMAATRHSNKVVATVAIDSVDFRHPVRMGEIVTLKAKLTWVGNTSMEVMVNAYAENPKSGAVIHTNQAFFTFVALDGNGKPSPVPQLRLETQEERDLFESALQRKNKKTNKS
ncbi:MAG TPA: acyl-CoA thioesterase [Bacillota bacterium]|nr:acyl-CoA thioesterase [Bacillota bacterium]HOL09766.1 acyl-CoA thioesterase [Bacillota bacterium]HPO98554.1 acyl-CoA thioesterase [Bacillota bacterium]